MPWIRVVVVMFPNPSSAASPMSNHSSAAGRNIAETMRYKAGECKLNGVNDDLLASC